MARIIRLACPTFYWTNFEQEKGSLRWTSLNSVTYPRVNIQVLYPLPRTHLKRDNHSLWQSIIDELTGPNGADDF